MEVTLMQTATSQTSPYSDFQTSTERYIYIALLGLNIILNLTLNTLGLLVLHRVHTIQATGKVFLRSLTISDIGIALFYALPSLVRALRPQITTGRASCSFKVASGMLLFHVNILSVLILTVDRYVSIVHCLRYPSIMTVPRARTLVCVLWALSIVYSLTYIIFSPPEYSDEAHICYQLKDSLNFSITIIIILTSVMVILALYTRLVMIAHRHKKRIAQQEFPSANPALRMRFKAKSLLTFCIIVLSLAVCWLPEVIALMVAKTTRRKNDILRWTFVLQNASCWLNMVIYYLRNKDFRQTAHGIFTTWLGSCKYCKSTDVRFEH